MTERKKLSEACGKLFEALEEITKLDEDWKKFRDWVITEYHKDTMKDYTIWNDYWFLLEALRYKRLPEELENRVLKDLAISYLLCQTDNVVYKHLSPWNWTLRELLSFSRTYYKLRSENGENI